MDSLQYMSEERLRANGKPTFPHRKVLKNLYIRHYRERRQEDTYILYTARPGLDMV